LLEGFSSLPVAVFDFQKKSEKSYFELVDHYTCEKYLVLHCI